MGHMHGMGRQQLSVVKLMIEAAFVNGGAFIQGATTPKLKQPLINLRNP